VKSYLNDYCTGAIPELIEGQTESRSERK